MLITLEGLDGSGKTTAWEHLRDRYTEYCFTREPTHSWYGDAVSRSLNNDNADPLAELFLFMADHADHLHRRIIPALNQGKTVISDRYSDSRIAYQSAALAESRLENPFEYIRSLHRPFSYSPDLTIYFSIDPETAAERAGATNKFERTDYLRLVEAQYERLFSAGTRRVTRIDATQPKTAVANQVSERIDAAMS
jgi:dTMP kinase